MRKRNCLCVLFGAVVVTGMTGCNLDMLDSNGDGTISLSELDADGDGVISQSDLFVAFVNAIANCDSNDSTVSGNSGTGTSPASGAAKK